MPGKLKVKIVAGRGLPVMDRSTDLTDAFVEVRFSSEVMKTDVFKKSLNPQWNSDWFRFEVEDEVLQDEPLELRVLDHDTYSAHDAIGKVYIDLNPLLVKDSPSVISGWFPIYDTMHGIRGDLNILVKIELFSDSNKFRQSSCGVQFFCTSDVPSGYRLLYMHGFVEELVVNDDPEYQWIDKIRTPRSSNEARQRLFSKMSGQLTRKIGLKVLEMGGSAVIGYNQCFDLEGESGIVIRGIGTAVTLTKFKDMPASPLGVSPLKDCRPFIQPLRISMPLVISTNSSTPSTPNRRSVHFSQSFPLSGTPPTPQTAPLLNQHDHTSSLSFPSAPPSFPATPTSVPAHSSLSPSHFAFDFTYSSPVPEDHVAPSSPPSQTLRSSTSPVKVLVPAGNRSSDSDISTPPKGNSLGGSSGSGSASGGTKVFPKPCSQQINIELMEFPFFTMTSFPPGFIVHIGGVVAAKSVKLLDKIHNPEEPETRDAWWTEIRTEIRSHTRALGCHAVIGYSEHSTICDEIIVLSAMGTAAKVSLNVERYHTVKPSPQQLAVTMDKYLAVDKEKDHGKKLFVDVNLANQVFSQRYHRYESSDDGSPLFNCSVCHIPYKKSSAPFPITMTHCAICRRRNVPDVLFTTINPPAEIQTFGKGVFIQARVCRAKAANKGEGNAKEISDMLPFLEYELHNQLINKLKIRSMNGLFGLKVQIVVGENMLIAIAGERQGIYCSSCTNFYSSIRADEWNWQPLQLTGTGAFLAPLPPPPVPRILGQITSEEENVALLEIQRKLTEKIKKNKDLYDLNGVDLSGQPSPRSTNTDDSDDESSELEFSTGNKDTFILEVDDTRDETLEAMLEQEYNPPGMELCNTETCPGISGASYISNIQMFTQVYRRRIDVEQRLKQDFAEIFDTLLRKLFFKLRRMVPCCLCNLSFNVEVPEEDEIQIVVNGNCVAIEENPPQTGFLAEGQMPSAVQKSSSKSGSSMAGASGENLDDMMFTMEEITEGSGTSGLKVIKPKQESAKKKPARVIQKPVNGIEITPQSYIPGTRIEKYIGSYNFFFIRETTSVREVGGVCGFMQRFVGEVLAIVRANVSSLGGNALVAYKMTQCILMTTEHKNQCQCLINVCGDAVYAVSKDGDITAVVPDLGRKYMESPAS